MTNLKNSVRLIGHLGKDPETTTFDNDKMKVRFSLATSDSYRNANGEKVEETQWHNIICWNGTAKVAAQYLKKGKQIALEGKLTTRSWDENGQKRYITEVVANQILLLDKKGK